MSTKRSRVLVAVFDLRERAERAAEQLSVDGHEWEYVRLLAGPDVPPECADEWSAAGFTAEEVGYYAGELRAGRWLVAVCSHTDDIAGVLSAFGRHGGSVNVPTEVRDDRM
ncbi:hypothetical protein J8F10_31825 [Gemmata sp. G18]|uniref:Uncharacterized protein n=1 Tax=Gemmata palustris TaxID=2822762 RepID=A0ABS5C1L4_9BACT|nr:hypothetical protein [Gemmata palustris]MBP3959861.1 hypothetical protein [Gemmata palustris]